MIFGTKKNGAVPLFHSCVDGTARRIPPVPASKKNLCRQGWQHHPAVVGRCTSTAPAWCRSASAKNLVVVFCKRNVSFSGSINREN